MGVTVWIAGSTALADCTLTNTDVTPLNELGLNLYQGFSGGLYPNGANNPPPAHLAAAIDIAQNQMKPLDGEGNVDTNNGKIVLLSLGVSNTTQEWASGDEITHNITNAFKYRADNDPSKNPQLVIVDGAFDGEDAKRWTNLNAPNWERVLTQRLNQAAVTTNQVQALWVKQAVVQPLTNHGAFPAHAQALRTMLAMIVRNAKVRYPNLKLAYLSCRTRAYTAVPTTLNPEPFAFETAFADKWVIEDQIAGQTNLTFDPAKGTVVAPWLGWGPYLWADGTRPRSDGFVWNCDDLRNDFTHPSSNGVSKVASQLLAFFKTDPTAVPWFLRNSIVGQPPDCTIAADVTNGVSPLTVNFSANATDPDGTIHDYQWTFDDGTFSTNSNPTKVFWNPGVHTARVTVTDSDGNAVTRSLPITIAAVELGGASFATNQFQFTVSGVTNYHYVVQRSEDLVEWLAVATNQGPFIFIEADLTAPKRYFRALAQP
jgi:hypothetical protein